MDRLPLTRVDIEIMNTTWWDDQFQFGDPNDFTWTLNGLTFYLGIKRHDEDATPIVTFTSAAGQIVVQDPINRILGMFVPDATIRANLPEGKYIYDLIMVANSNGQTDGLMYGELSVKQGITIGPS
jgi:hypothetical protein